MGGRIEEFRVNLTGAKPHLFQYIMYGSSPESVDQHKPDNDIKPLPIDLQTWNNLPCIYRELGIVERAMMYTPCMLQD